ncbi:hypothetical protein IJ21_20090 [Paenibacillus sp. 32O-W]|uniref:hypothetical protein n=1 Tax=Paenibacillus sp. 32O-W TaxID=1695218 RepID=UPI000721E8FE|nr:hypothetical protein [Paenibacillus sp. 32O-W]ALS27406.1 hypothetical protein IJ21_20090 [Paenibacillus sp. 32O-W]
MDSNGSDWKIVAGFMAAAVCLMLLPAALPGCDDQRHAVPADVRAEQSVRGNVYTDEVRTDVYGKTEPLPPGYTPPSGQDMFGSYGADDPDHPALLPSDEEDAGRSDKNGEAEALP